ncbi:hypothetical protein [Nocardia carnea]|uniref:hypothetical protein n=2 Tax=Nocardiaceae TaxID=85025 RepID=UPI002457FAD5|nr:hypothetical protein [Nocardia carnea]
MASHRAPRTADLRVEYRPAAHYSNNGLITQPVGYPKDMTALRNRPARIAGMEWGTALLALATCLIFGTGIAAITQSFSTALIATASILVGLGITLRILRSPR